MEFSKDNNKNTLLTIGELILVYKITLTEKLILLLIK